MAQEITVVPYGVYLINQLADLYPRTFMAVVYGLLILVVVLIAKSLFKRS